MSLHDRSLKSELVYDLVSPTCHTYFDKPTMDDGSHGMRQDVDTSLVPAELSYQALKTRHHLLSVSRSQMARVKQVHRDAGL